MMRSPEASCERWGSLIHMLWDGISGWQPHRVVSRLLIREAGLYCDEAVVREIALCLRDRRGMDPYARNHGEAPEGAGVSVALSEDLIVRRGLAEAKFEALKEYSLTEEMDLATLSTPRNEPGVSAGFSEEDPVAKAARDRHPWLRSLSRETKGRVHFCNTQDDLVAQSQNDMKTMPALL